MKPIDPTDPPARLLVSVAIARSVGECSLNSGSCFFSSLEGDVLVDVCAYPERGLVSLGSDLRSCSHIYRFTRSKKRKNREMVDVLVSKSASTSRRPNKPGSGEK